MSAGSATEAGAGIEAIKALVDEWKMEQTNKAKAEDKTLMYLEQIPGDNDSDDEDEDEEEDEEEAASPITRARLDKVKRAFIPHALFHHIQVVQCEFSLIGGDDDYPAGYHDIFPDQKQMDREKLLPPAMIASLEKSLQAYKTTGNDQEYMAMCNALVPMGISASQLLYKRAKAAAGAGGAALKEQDFMCLAERETQQALYGVLGEHDKDTAHAVNKCHGWAGVQRASGMTMKNTRHAVQAYKLAVKHMKTVERLLAAGQASTALGVLMGIIWALRRDGHWYYDTDSPNKARSLVSKLDKLWRAVMSSSTEALGLDAHSHAALNAFVWATAQEWLEEMDSMF